MGLRWNIVAVLAIATITAIASGSGLETRIACLGDSITAGARVDADRESYPAVLQQRGIATITARLRDVAPRARILVLGILPRGERPDDPLRKRAVEVNTWLVGQPHLLHVHVLDVSPRLLLPDGHANPDLMAGDFVHLTTAGYRVLSEALRPEIDRLLAIETEPATPRPKPGAGGA